MSNIDDGKREHGRWETRLEITFATLDDGGRRLISGEARDLSAGGICFHTSHYLTIGEEVEMEIRAPEFPRPLRAVGRTQRVVRHAGMFEVGVRFLSNAVREDLDRILAHYL